MAKKLKINTELKEKLEKLYKEIYDTFGSDEFANFFHFVIDVIGRCAIIVHSKRVTYKYTNVMNKYQQLVELYNKAFDHFNATLFNNALPKVIITIQTRGRKKCYGWFWKDRWNEAGKPAHEINMSAENINRTKEDQCETLIHEMVHLYNAIRDIADCNSLQYHNKHFKSAAEEAGLLVMKYPGRGWAMTSLGEKAKKAVDDFTETFPSDTFRPEKKATYNRIYTVMCSEDDYNTFKALQLGMTQKELFSKMLTAYTNSSMLVTT